VTEYERANAFEEGLRERAAERVVPYRFGTAVFTDSLPTIWDGNALRVERGEPSAEELVEEADGVQGEAGLAHRRLFVFDETLARRLAPAFRQLGWEINRYLVMLPRRQPDRKPSAPVFEIERPAAHPLRARIAREGKWSETEEDVRSSLAFGDRIAAVGNGRQFAVAEGGEVLSCADLYSDGRTAQIEDVSTLPEARSRGYGSAVVLAALEAARGAGHDLVFLCADDDDWPKALYARLGFDPIGVKYGFLRKPALPRG
jgi:GNAT superfamily N-acetyltransferase